MQRIEVHPDNPQPRALQQACSVLRDDGVVAFLTDTGYTLACEVGSHAGVQLIRRVRALDDQHLLTVLCQRQNKCLSVCVTHNVKLLV